MSKIRIKQVKQLSQSTGDTRHDKRTCMRASAVEDKSINEFLDQKSKNGSDVDDGSSFNFHKVGHLSSDCHMDTKRKPMSQIILKNQMGFC